MYILYIYMYILYIYIYMYIYIYIYNAWCLALTSIGPDKVFWGTTEVDFL